MSRGQPQALNLFGWAIGPSLLAIVATVLMGTPLRVFGLALPEPVWPMVLAFAWPIIRPSLITPLILLLTGLFLDLYWGTAMGQWALGLLVPYTAALLGRRLLVGQSGAALWAWYVGLTAIGFGVVHMVSSGDLAATPQAAAVGLQAFVTALLYPLAHRLIERYEDAGARI